MKAFVIPNAVVFSQDRALGVAAGRRHPGAESRPAWILPINLNPDPVTVNGVTYPTGRSARPAPCDPRGIGLNPIVNDIWSKQMPLANNPLGGDTYNTQAFLGSIRAPLTSNNYVGRIDHDFSDKEHFYVTYRDYKLVNLTSNQTDVGGVLPAARSAPPSPPRPGPSSLRSGPPG